jgi:Zn-dependent protease
MNLSMQEFLQQGLPVGRVIGVRVRLHVTLLLFLLLILMNFLPGSPSFFSALLNSLIVSIILFGSVLLHELGHCYGAQLVGGYAHEIVLWPLGGMALVGGTNRNPKTDLIVTALGPAVSVALALIGWLAYTLLGQFWEQGFLLDYFYFFALINTMLAVFNLCCPLFPMDSARIVRALFSLYYNPNKVTYYLCTFGMYLGGALALFLFIPGSFSFLPLIGIFGAFSCYQELQLNKLYPVYTEYYAQSGLRGLFSQGLPKSTVKNPFSTWFSRLRRRRRRSGPAKVVNIKKNSETDLYRQMLDAAEREDFEEAARLRDLLEKKRK